MKIKDLSYVALGFCIAVICAVSSADLVDAENAHRIHCEAVAQWESDAALDVEPAQRRGWPNYDMRKCDL